MDLSIENKLKALWALQEIDSKLDQLEALKGELPIEVADLEDEITGLQTRLQNIHNEIGGLQEQIGNYKNKIKQSEQFIVKFKQQLNDVKNNREYEALTKEIEIMELEIQAADKRIKDAQRIIESKSESIAETEAKIEAGRKELEIKNAELVTIIAETEAEEDALGVERKQAAMKIEERLSFSYSKIRKNARNGVAIAPIIRSSCGGCFAKIPPQRQADIRQHLKVTACEHCGRIVVDGSITGIQAEIIETEDKPKRRLKKRLGANPA
jgi:predicted  nucleic acid-binding Zn-ribbon protein